MIKLSKKYRLSGYKKGNAWVGIMVLLVFMITVGLALVTDVIGTITQSKKAEQVIVAQALCDAGIEKAIWKLNQTGGSYGGENDLNLNTGIIDIAVSNINSETRIVEATAYVPSKAVTKITRKVRAKIMAEFNDTNISFHYGVQVGELGVTMSNNSKVLGNVYTDGSIIAGNGAEITGDAYVSGAANKIQNLIVGNDAHAHTIEDSSIGRDAYYTVLSKSSVGRTKYPDSTDPSPIGLPLAQSTIDQWESWAEAGGTFIGNKTITDGATETLGPLKIDGDLTVTNGATLTMSGLLWVTGNVYFSNNAIIKLIPAFGASSSMIVADSPTNKALYGKVIISNNVSVQGSGTPKSYIMIASTNTGSTIADPAINAANNSTAVVYYTLSGMIEVANNAHLKALSGGGLHLSNGAIVEYDSGLVSADFSGGPGGSWQLKEWQIVP